jgi:hypothetical protein
MDKEINTKLCLENFYGELFGDFDVDGRRMLRRE